jgi:hypothetical protein
MSPNNKRESLEKKTNSLLGKVQILEDYIIPVGVSDEEMVCQYWKFPNTINFVQ